jgi:hypothetical protein
MAIKITTEAYKQKFGVPPPIKQPVAKVGFGTRAKQAVKDTFSPYISQTKDAFKSGLSQTVSGYKDSFGATKDFSPARIVEGANKMVAGVANTAFSPVAPIFKPVEKGINSFADWVGEFEGVQKFAESPAGEATSRVVEDVANTNTVVGVIAGLRSPSPKTRGPRTARPATVEVEPAGPANTASRGPGALGYAKSVVRDIVPTKQGFINEQVTKALDLSAGDLDKISRSTGNELGRWMADNNLIDTNKARTQINVDKFFSENYGNVRAEIARADTVRPPRLAVDVDGYQQALGALRKQLTEVPGQESALAEVNSLIKKESVTIADVQRAKELVDGHFKLYSVVGDVAQSVEKQGLANIRSQLQKYIETEVREGTGADIRAMNNNVATAKTISDAISLRSPKGLTRSNLRIGDLGIFGIGAATGGPLVGLALLFGKKVLESSTVRLRLAKYIDQFSDSQKARMMQDMESGNIPAELKRFVKPRGSESKSSGEKPK